MRWLPRLSMATWLRLGLALVSLLFAARGPVVTALPWVLLVATIDLAATALQPARAEANSVRRKQAFALMCVGAVVAGAAMGFGGLWAKVLILIPAFHAGLRFGRLGTTLVTVIGGAAAFTGAILDRSLDGTQSERIGIALLSALVMGLLGAWSHRMEDAKPALVDPNVAAEAGLLLRRLHELADTLDTGFDAPGSAEMALQELSGRMRAARSAVLVGYGTNPAVPLAIRGADRAPWPEPTVPGSVLWEAWHHGTPTLREWEGDLVERSLIAVPLFDDRGQRLGLLVADRPLVTPFSQEDLNAAAEVAARHAANIDLSVLFAGLRERAGLEERERLAREMHDGIAQEMVAIGFGIDALRRVAQEQRSPLAEGLDGLRADVSRVLADLRLHIADLRIAVRPDTGLGALIGARLQNFGSTSGVTTRIHLSETGFRLPAHTEVLIYRLFIQVLSDARHAMDAEAIEVRLNVAAPKAELWVSHDGTAGLSQRDFEGHPLLALGGEITVEPYAERGVSVRMRMRARGATPSANLSNERIPQPS
jgi:signal transduction histidine kinase